MTTISPQHGCTTVSAHTVILACGAREKTATERGWIAGHRTARFFHTMQLLDMLNAHSDLPVNRPIVLGSDLIALSVAAKLCSAGADDAVMVDVAFRPECSWLVRMYFRQWCRPRWYGRVDVVDIVDEGTIEVTQGKRTQKIHGDGIVISGTLVSNSELAVAAGLDVLMPSRCPVVNRRSELSAPGWFTAGNMDGGWRGAYSCYRNGMRVARFVAKDLKMGPSRRS